MNDSIPGGGVSGLGVDRVIGLPVGAVPDRIFSVGAGCLIHTALRGGRYGRWRMGSERGLCSAAYFVDQGKPPVSLALVLLERG